MFKWLKDKAEKAAARQCRFNIKLDVKTLVSIANDADARIEATGSSHDPDVARVHRAQVSLLDDIKLGMANAMTVEDVRSVIADACVGETMSTGAKSRRRARPTPRSTGPPPGGHGAWP